MKLFIILHVFLVAEFVHGADLHLNTFKPADNELQRKVLELSLENGQLHKTISELRIENANLMTELFAIKEREKLLSEESELTFWNCSGLATQLDDVSGSLTTLQDDIQSFKPLIKERLTAYANKLGIIEKNNIEKATPCECVPKSNDNDELLQVACSPERSNGTWTVVLRRMDGKTNFYRPWEQYKAGFGTMTGEFFIGLENLHLLTTCVTQELLIEMIDGDNQKRHAKYDAFEISGERESYALKELGTYSGDAGDSLVYHKSQMFTTYDRDNDPNPNNCAKRYKGAWWHNNCHHSNINGDYGNNKFGEGINWYHFRGHEYSLKFVEMKIRPKS